MLHDAERRPISEVLTKLLGPKESKRALVGAESLSMTCGTPRGYTLDDIVREAIAHFVGSTPKGDRVAYLMSIVRRLLRPGAMAESRAKDARANAKDREVSHVNGIDPMSLPSGESIMDANRRDHEREPFPIFATEEP